MSFYDESTVLYDDRKGLGEAWYILCPVCWSASVRVVHWESGEQEVEDCLLCKRMEREIPGKEV